MKSVVDHLWNLSVDDDICCPERAVSKRDERLRKGKWIYIGCFVFVMMQKFARNKTIAYE
jgi:hypothetical protein